jgi:hypothetical protein
MSRTPDPVRLSAKQGAIEFHVSYSSVKKGLKHAGIAQNWDYKYSIYELSKAIFKQDGLEEKGTAARWESKIHEAELKKIKRDELSGKLIKWEFIKKEWRDLITTISQRIRHNPSMTALEKKQLISEIEIDVGKRLEKS